MLLSDRLFKILNYFHKQNRLLSKEEIPFSYEDVKDLKQLGYIQLEEITLFHETGAFKGKFDKNVTKYIITANGVDALIEHKRDKRRRKISTGIALLTLAASIVTLLLTI